MLNAQLRFGGIFPPFAPGMALAAPTLASSPGVRMQIVVVERRWKRFSLLLSAAFALVALNANVSAAREELCDPSFQDCRTPLINLMKAETTEIDVGLWF